ncbi:MAG: alpha/beta hydrolase [Mesorhizobium sp.]|nr:MAG: alpha/beta hydrolase [Mesorhizobium sp.]
MFAKHSGYIFLGAATIACLALANASRARRALLGRRPGKFIEVNGTCLHFLEAGVGMPLLLLHGNGASVEDFTTSGIFGQAAEKYRVVAFDRPGFGRSTRPSGKAWSASAQADLIHAAAGKLGIRHYMVLGHSWGAAVALELARRHPRSVTGLVVVSGYYYPQPRLGLFLSALPALPLAGLAWRHTLLPLLVRLAWPWAMAKIFNPGRVPAEFAGITKELASRPAQLLSISAESALMLAAALLPRLDYRDIVTPTGIVAGAGDKLFDAKRQASRLHAELRGSLLQIVPHAGHMAHHTASQAVLAMIDDVAALGMAPPSRATASSGN